MPEVDEDAAEVFVVFLDAVVERYEKEVGPHNGAQVVAKAWAEPDYRRWLLEDADAAIASLGHVGRQGEHMVAVENTPDTTWSCARCTAEVRYLVVPMRPEGTEGLSQEQLAALVTRDSMIGTGLARAPHEVSR